MKSIIIVTYNSSAYINQCLESVEKNISATDQVFVIDNNSYDGTVNRVDEFIASKNNFRLIVEKNNLGFAKAVNIGLEMSQGEYIFLINPDTIFEEGILDKIISLAEEKSADICGIRQVDEKGKPSGSFGKYPSAIVNFFEKIWLAKIFPLGRYVRHNFLTKILFKSNRQVDWVGGGFMLINRKVTEIIGLLDENFFMYFEDVDFCKRAKKVGFKTWFLGDIEGVHYEGKSFTSKNIGCRKKYSQKSFRYFMKKHKPISLAYKISAFNRKRKWNIFNKIVKFNSKTKILDVGFSNEEYSSTDNFLEKNYPFSENITAISVDSYEKFSLRYPKVKAMQYDGEKIPFEDNEFDVVWSNAVIEHVGDKNKQINFLKEINRVSKKAFLTTPNRNFPFEVHTRVPLVHIFLSKKYFDKFLGLIGMNWATDDYMHLISVSGIKKMLSKAGIKKYRIIKNKLFFFTLDFVVFIEK